MSKSDSKDNLGYEEFFKKIEETRTVKTDIDPNSFYKKLEEASSERPSNLMSPDAKSVKKTKENQNEVKNESKLG